MPSPASKAAARTAALAARAPVPFRVTGLDGLRALAVVAVLLYHLSPGGVVGGYIGVDVFFVVSGFLITSLLLRERAASGRIRVWAFWRRRARRLVPALIVLLLVCCTLAFAIGGDVLVGIGAQVAGSLTFSINWVLIASGANYFAASSPELFRNLWSLAVEEQFYLLWPLVVIVIIARVTRTTRITFLAVLTVASAAAMAVLVITTDPTRVYFGTDTHSFGLTLGALLAVVAQWWPTRALEWPRAARRTLGWLALGALGGLVVLAMTMPADVLWVYQGGLLAVAVLTAVVILGLLVPASPLGRAMDAPPLKWIGQRSYAIYLWHWPLYILALSAFPTWPQTGASGWLFGGIVAAVTVALAALSYRFVERGIRRDGFRAAFRRFGARWRRSVPALLGGVAVLALFAFTLAGTTAAIATAPRVTQTEAQLQAGRVAIATAPATDPEPTPEPSTGPDPLDGRQISAIGDSVMLAAAPELQAAFPGISIDALVSRQIAEAPVLLRHQLRNHTLRPVVVLGLGTNGPIPRGVLTAVLRTIGPDRELVLITAQAPRGWIPGVNITLSQVADRYRNVELSRWHDAIQPHLAVLNRDQVHFGGAGARIYTASLKAALQRLANLPPPPDAADVAARRPI